MSLTSTTWLVFSVLKIKDIVFMLIIPVVSCLLLGAMIIIITFMIIPEIPGTEETTSMDITVVAVAVPIGAGVLLTIAIAVVISTICCCIKKKQRKSVDLEKERSTILTVDLEKERSTTLTVDLEKERSTILTNTVKETDL